MDLVLHVVMVGPICSWAGIEDAPRTTTPKRKKTAISVSKQENDDTIADAKYATDHKNGKMENKKEDTEINRSKKKATKRKMDL